MKKIILLIFIAFSLGSCSEVELASHLAKKSMSSNRSAQKGTFKVGNPYKIAGKTYYPKEQYNLVEKGIASWYGPNFHGKQTANGEIFDKYELTAAHKTLQMPSLVRVTNLHNGRSLVVRINDRGPYKRGRIIDLSEKAAELLGFKLQGTAKVKIEVLNQESRQIAKIAKNGIDTGGYEIAANQGRKTVARAQHIEPAAGAAKSYGYMKKAVTVPAVDYKFLSAPNELKPELIKDIMPGHNKDGQFYPDPFVAEMPVTETLIYVQAGSFTVFQNADKLRNRLSHVADTNILPTNVNGIKYYRVRLGPIDSVEKADNVLDKVIASGMVNAIIVVDEPIFH